MKMTPKRLKELAEGKIFGEPLGIEEVSELAMEVIELRAQLERLESRRHGQGVL